MAVSNQLGLPKNTWNTLYDQAEKCFIRDVETDSYYLHPKWVQFRKNLNIQLAEQMGGRPEATDLEPAEEYFSPDTDAKRRERKRLREMSPRSRVPSPTTSIAMENYERDIEITGERPPLERSMSRSPEPRELTPLDLLPSSQMADDGLQFSKDHYVEVAEKIYDVKGAEGVAQRMKDNYYQRGTIPGQDVLLSEVLKQDLERVNE